MAIIGSDVSLITNAISSDRHLHVLPSVYPPRLDQQIMCELTSSESFITTQPVFDHIFTHRRDSSFDDCVDIVHRHMRSHPYNLVIFSNLCNGTVRISDDVDNRKYIEYLSMFLPVYCKSYGMKYVTVLKESDIRNAINIVISISSWNP